MDSFSPLQRTDISEVAQLFHKIFRRSSSPPPPALSAYLEKIYIDNPWQEGIVQSRVYKHDDRVAGFIGVMPFPMTIHGRAIRAAIGGNFMIDPGVANAMVGPRLLKMFLTGPQDLAFTDTATDQGRKMLEGLGSTAIPLYSLQWLRVLRPISFTAIMGSRNKVLAPLAVLAKPVSSLIDKTLSVLPKSPFRNEKLRFRVEALSTRCLLDAIRDQAAQRALAPVYTEASLEWLMKNAEEKKEYGPLRSIALYTNEHVLQGWVLYYPNAGRIGQVMQLGATPRTALAVLSHLFADAWEHGSLALAGRMEPKFMAELSQLNCIFMHRNSSVVVRSNDAEIMAALHSGDAFFSRLEGEWWTRLQGDTFAETA